MEIIEITKRALVLSPAEIKQLKHILAYTRHRIEKHESKGAHWLCDNGCREVIDDIMRNLA